MDDSQQRRYFEGRLAGLKVNRYSWWTHWRELADYFLPRRYKWLITPNQMARGSPINQHIIDSTGCVALRNMAAGLMSGKTPPSRLWFKYKIGTIDSTGNNPVSRWLYDCEQVVRRVFHESNFYNSIATFFTDLAAFNTATMIIYEDYENVIWCYNPCAGEYYVDIDGQYRPCILYREFTMSIYALVKRFRIENCSPNIQKMYRENDGSNLTREIIVGHAIEPNDKDRDIGIPEVFTYREVYWEWGGSQSQQSGSGESRGFLEKKGFHEQPQMTARWDLVSNDAYGRGPSMDALGDQKQLQLETKRKAQAIDKMVNPPLVADVQLKNQPASLLPGGMTYITGFAQSGKAAIASIYDTKFPVNEISEDLAEVRERIKKTFFNDLFQPLSQYETRSNITIDEVNQRKSEALIMIGPVFERLDHEGLKVLHERVWGICSRAGIFPPPPAEIADMNVETEFVSLLNVVQSATEATAIEKIFAWVGQVGAVDPSAYDNVDVDYGINKYSSLLSIDPKIIRSPEALNELRTRRQEQAQQMQQAEMAEKMAAGAKTLSETDVGGGMNALQAMTGNNV
jgi:hypothetical protein